MRWTLKHSLAFFVAYGLIVGAVGFWTFRELHSLAESLAEDTAKLIGSEIARTISDSALDELLTGNETTRLELESVLTEVTKHSTMLTSLAIVDRNGATVTGQNVPVGGRLALPEVLFGESRRPRILSLGQPMSGEFFLVAPLVRNDELAGYVRLSMRSRRISTLATNTLSELVVVALGGLLAIALLAGALQAQLVRRSRALALALERAVRGENVDGELGDDEFGRALSVAHEVGRELTEARGEKAQARQRMGALMRAMDVGTLMVEPDGSLLFANDRAAELFGWPDPSALEKHWSEVQSEMGDWLEQRDGGSNSRDLELAAGERAPRLRLERCGLGDDAAAGYLITVRSAESLEALERELGLAIQMRGLTRFYAAFAHDLKAPLNAMVMTVELLKAALPPADGSDPESEAKRERYLGVLNQEIRRLDRQVHTLLAHTAPPNDQRSELDLRKLVDELLALLAPQAKRQRVNIITEAPDEPVRLLGYADRLKQALLNVFINALEAMPSGGELHLGIERNGEKVKLSVRDTGEGIAAEALDSIFQMRFTTKSGGTGVGLYVARSVVQAHGGKIAVESVADQGTAFSIELPLAPAREA